MGGDPKLTNSPSTLDLGGVPFDRMFELRRGDARRPGGDATGSLAAWDEAFGEVVAQVAKRVRHQFGNEDLAGSVARSAFGTFVRRSREGATPGDALDQVDGPDALVGYLVTIAYEKAAKRLATLRREVQASVLGEGGFEAVAPQQDRAEDEDRLVIRKAVCAEMQAQFDRIFERLGLQVKDGQAPILYALYVQKYQDSLDPEALQAMLKRLGLRKLTCKEIAAKNGITERTLYNLRKKVDAQWPGLIQEATEAVRALQERLNRYVEA
jgi:hypothetical protein